MSTMALNISVTGIRAASQMAAATSQNIANMNTPGYRRVDVVTQELNFSGPGNTPWLPAGVSTQAVTPNQPWLDDRLNMASTQSAQGRAFQSALEEFAQAARTEGMETAFSDLMAASQDALANPTDSAVLARFQATLQGLTQEINQFQDLVRSAIERLQTRVGVSQAELETTSDPVRQRSLQGEIQGINQALNGPIDSISQEIGGVIEQAVQDINAQSGVEFFNQLPNGRVENLPSDPATADFLSLTEYGSQAFNTDLGAANSRMGVELRSAANRQEFADQEFLSAQAAWNDVYGVDLTQEAVKLRQIETYQQANVLAASVASNMIGTLIEKLA